MTRHRTLVRAQAQNIETRRTGVLDPSYISALAALAGSARGGLTTLGAAGVTQDRQQNAQRLEQDKIKRQELYKSFVEDASKLYADALAHDQAKISDLVSMYAAVSEMRVISSSIVAQKAEAVVRVIVDTYFAPNRTFPELRQLIDSHAIDPLRDFSLACRDELRSDVP